MTWHLIPSVWKGPEYRLVIPRRDAPAGDFRQAARVAALPWNQWQHSRGMGGRLRLESVAGLVWNTHYVEQTPKRRRNDA